jgi:hypothetical protein
MSPKRSHIANELTLLDEAAPSEPGASQMLRFCCGQQHPDLLEQE